MKLLEKNLWNKYVTTQTNFYLICFITIAKCYEVNEINKKKKAHTFLKNKDYRPSSLGSFKWYSIIFKHCQLDLKSNKNLLDETGIDCNFDLGEMENINFEWNGTSLFDLFWHSPLSKF